MIVLTKVYDTSDSGHADYALLIIDTPLAQKIAAARKRAFVSPPAELSGVIEVAFNSNEMEVQYFSSYCFGELVGPEEASLLGENKILTEQQWHELEHQEHTVLPDDFKFPESKSSTGTPIDPQFFTESDYLILCESTFYFRSYGHEVKLETFSLPYDVLNRLL